VAEGSGLAVLGLIAAFAALLLNGVLSLDAAGLAERTLTLVVFLSSMGTSIRTCRLA
jgi:hypothetical protein